ncbi:hypothetical protein [Pelagicoccus albus]|uniref:Uncharacterized protein n=1 Tax=Pelagicoccus albus TaxID=415222 RepID=A0A7X1B7F1_9BACT|nr:hypothetical protein [Pelagicoccus albus]MBC2606789.1 hypothetical protein [Pelagicoccus albus]
MSRLIRVLPLLALALFLALTFRESKLRLVAIEERSVSDYNGDTLFSGEGSELRELVPSGRNDELHWIMNVQQSIRDGDGRVRNVDHDNAPEGREVHWSSVYASWIRLLAGNDEGKVEWAALAANLVLVLITTACLTVLLWRFFDPWIATLVPFSMAALLAFRDTHKLGVGDHHAPAILSVVVGLLLLMISVRQIGKSKGATLLACSSSLSFALGMWINVVSVIPVFAGLAAAIVLHGLIAKGSVSDETAGEYGRLVRFWAWSGGLFSLLCYLVEYAPANMGWRFEVNHPVYSLSWIGMGEVLALFFRFNDRSRVRRLVLGLGLLSVAPLAILLAGMDSMQIFDPFLLAMHNRYLAEFQGLFANLALGSSALRSIATLLPFVSIAAALLIWIQIRKSKPALLLLIGFFPAALLLILSLYQARWIAEASALLLPLSVALYSVSGFRLGKVLVFGGVIPGLAVFALGAFAISPDADEVRQRKIEKDVARYLRARFGESTILASPDATTNLLYYGGHKGIGTFYWENNVGLKRAARLFASPNLEEAQKRFSEAGIDFVVIYSWGGFEKEYLKLYQEYEDESIDLENAFLTRLVERQEIPNWLEPIPYRLDGQEGDLVLIFRVVPKMNPGEALAVRFEYLLEMGFADAALALVPLLERVPGSLPAQISLCRAYAMQERGQEFVEVLQGVLNLNSSSFESLELVDTVRLSGLSLLGGQRDLAAWLLEESLARLDKKMIRSLNGEDLRRLLDLVEALGLNGYTPELRSFSEAILPPSLRR